VSILPCEDGSD